MYISDAIAYTTSECAGLFHTFQGKSCSIDNRGDYVNDTPQHLAPSVDANVECVLEANTCPDDIVNIDPVFNYMNYQNGDDCVPERKGEFTCGQIERMVCSSSYY